MAHSHHTGGMLRMDVLAASSRLRRVSPAIKALLCILSLVLCVAAADAAVGAVVALSMAGIVCRLGGVRVREFLRLLRLPLVFLVVSCLVILIEPGAREHAAASLRLGRLVLCVTERSLASAVTLFFQALGAVCCLFFLSTTTPLPQLIELMRRCRLPEILIELMYLIYRYLFVLLQVQQQMTQAADARLGFRGLRRSVGTAGRISGALLASSFRRSSACYDAMLARGYDGKLAFLTAAPAFRLRHALCAAGYLLALGLLAALRKRGIV